MTKEEALQQCTVEGNIVKLPGTQLDRKVYQEVKKSLELIGGKWKSGNTQGFVFSSDPSELLESIQGGEKRNLKKEFQFFGTPAELADEMVARASIMHFMKVLEPSAGQGAIVAAIHRQHPEMIVDCCELMDTNRIMLKRMNYINLIADDFMQVMPGQRYDCIVANPPFSKNQDIDHIRRMYSMLNNGGRIVTIASKHWQLSSNKKETDFRDWLDSVGADVQEIDAETFKESGTKIATVMITIDKF